MAAKPDRSLDEEVYRVLLSDRKYRETAEAVGVTRQTVCEWRLRDVEFREALNLRRRELWDGQTERLRGLVSKAVDVLEGGLQAEDPRLQQSAAVHILKAVSLYGTPREPQTGFLASMPED